MSWMNNPEMLPEEGWMTYRGNVIRKDRAGTVHFFDGQDFMCNALRGTNKVPKIDPEYGKKKCPKCLEQVEARFPDPDYGLLRFLYG